VLQEKKIIIIGCGAGGGTAAQFARKQNRKAKITIIEKGNFAQYSKCGLPYVISGDIKNFDNLIEFSKEWFNKSNINILSNTSVESIDKINKKIIVKNNNSITKKSYDSIIIASGSNPQIPPFENINKDELPKGFHFLRTIEDGKKILKEISNIKKATIIGAGLIGLEIADSLYKKGIEINIIEALPEILSKTIDKDISNTIQEKISKTINLFTNYLITRIEKKGRDYKLFIKNNATFEKITIDTDLVIIATGTYPEIKIAKEAGCEIGVTGGIIVDNKSQTSLNNIFAVGDCTEYLDFVTKKPISIGLGSIVVRQGIAAGINAAGGNYTLPEGFLQTCTSKFFGFELASVGPISNNLDKNEIISSKYEGLSLPNYYPGGKLIKIKLIIDKKTGYILAAQGIGDNISLRINTIACAILNRMNVEIFRKLETAYAPPLAPTLDVITIVSDIAYKKLKRIN
jgi:NADH oxidase (H2O2-forming)